MQQVSNRFIPIINPGKCGSSWLAHAITVPPHIAFLRELDFLQFITRPPEEQWNRGTSDDPEFVAVRDREDLSDDEKLLELYRIEGSRASWARLLVDKAPSNTLHFLRFRHLFRGCRIVMLYRDPRDCFVSREFYAQRQLGTRPERSDIGDPDYLRDQSELRLAIANSRRTLEVERTLRSEAFDVLTIRYEEMKADFPGTVWKVLHHVAPHLGPTTLVRTPFFPKVLPLGLHIRRARNLRPLFRKGVVGDWRNHLDSEAAKDVFKELGGDLLIELGYENGTDW